MSEKQLQAAAHKPIKLRRKLKLRKKIKLIDPTVTCEELQQKYNNGDLKRTINDPEYQHLLKCVSDKDFKSLEENSEEFPYLYPNKDDAKFNVKIIKKKEFYDTRYEEHSAADYENIEQYTQTLCDNTEFELDPHQMFVRNFLSSQTPYNGLLLFHGLGTGKTCSAISVCEEMRTYSQQMGITKQIIIVASPAVQENFKLQLFDERKLIKINGLWNIKACIGNKFIKEINPMNMKGLSRNKIIKQIKKLIKQSYVFRGYTEFANYIARIMDKTVVPGDTDAVVEKKRTKSLRGEFSNRTLVIDEVHNIRLSKEGKVKASSDNLGKLIMATRNLKLLLLSATPMFDSYTEIIWILNLLNLNDNRYPITESEVFTKSGSFKIQNGEESGKELLIRKATGYISYVRGENPFTFPYRIWPQEAINPKSLFSLARDGVWKYPQYQINGGEIVRPIEFIDLVISNIGEYQSIGYNKLITYLKDKYSILTNPAAGIPYTILEAPLQTLNMVYPHYKLGIEDDGKKGSETSEGEAKANMGEDVLNYIYGSKGLSRVMKYDLRTKREFVYKDVTLKHFGKIFEPGEIGKYSGKIAYICDQIRNSVGIVFIYSQYIDGGAIPMALALEEMGITRYGNVSSLFKTAPTENIDAITLKSRKAGTKFNPAKYIMITGQKTLTPDVKYELKAVTDKNNVNGEKVKIVIVTRAGAEGLDFQNIRQMHIIDPWYNINRAEQVIGRAVRNFSHCNLSYNKRNVVIYLYGTQLEDNNTEAIDLYVYRLAERKALKIANVTRVLKETSADCLLNRKGLNFSETAISSLTSSNVVQMKLSTGNTIDYTLGDKNNSLICDFRRCEYECKPYFDINEEDTNKDTYNETFIIMNLDKILQRIRNLFKEKYIYKKNVLLTEITIIKKYPIDQIYTALSYLINDDNEFITDSLNRLGYLVNVGDYYMFQPVELSDKHISRYERETPIPYKRKTLTFKLEDLPEPTNTNIEGIIENLITAHQLLITPEKISTNNKGSWARSGAWAIQNLVKYNAEKFGLDMDECFDIFVTLAMHHVIDILNYDEKILLLQHIGDIKEVIQNYVESYFKKFSIKTDKYEGLVITNFNKKSKYTILSLINGTWTNNKMAIAGGLGKVALDKFSVDIDDMNDKIGFMAQVKKYNLVFKIKSIKLSEAGRPTKGASCNRGGDKKLMIDLINTSLGGEIKYKMGASAGKGTRTIKQIYDNDGPDIIQHPYKKNKDGDLIKTANKYRLDKSVIVRINGFQLCIEQELIFRYYNKINKDNKLWFFSSLETIINNISKIGK